MTAATLEARGVSYAPSKSELPLLHETSFQVGAGEVLGIVGPNGSGKSTLLRLLYRFQKPVTGQIFVNGTDIWSMTAKESARQIAAVLQEQVSGLGLSVREIVRLGRTPHRSGFASPAKGDEAVVDDVLDRLDLRTLADRDLGTLSGGEKQRVMVARALAQEPKVLILDEPTNHLDIRHQLEIVDLIRDLPLTIVVSLHDLNVAAGVCDNVLVLRNGHPQGLGAPDDLLTNSLVSDTFRVDATREHLTPSGASHFTFSLRQENEQ